MNDILKRTLLSICLLLLLWPVTNAQNVLTLDQCLERARSNSLRLRQADDAIRKAEIARSELSSTALPSARIDVGASFAPASKHFGYDPAASNEGQLNGQIVVEQSIYDGGVRSLKATRLRLERDRLSGVKQSVERDVRFAVKQLFIETLRAQVEADLRRASVQRLAEYRELVKQLMAAGSANYTDFIKTQVELTTDSLSLRKAEEVVAITKYELADLMGAPTDTGFTAAGSLDDMVAALSAAGVIGTGLETTSSLDVQLADFDARTGEIDVKLTRHERWPVISAFADAGLLTTGQNLRLPAADRASIIGYSAGISLQLPLFDWGANRYRIQQQEITNDSLRLELTSVRRSIALEIRKANSQLANAAKRLGSVRANVAAAEDNFLLTKASFVSGGTLALEVLNAQQLFTEAKLAELETVAEVATLAATIEELTTH
ncbi:MAG: TolC family protein [candidate division Zixibacteria bacterium]|nr:TolC family protein [candidate division Zixibacteria bacterium]